MESKGLWPFRVLRRAARWPPRLFFLHTCVIDAPACHKHSISAALWGWPQPPLLHTAIPMVLPCWTRYLALESPGCTWLPSMRVGRAVPHTPPHELWQALVPQLTAIRTHMPARCSCQVHPEGLWAAWRRAPYTGVATACPQASSCSRPGTAGCSSMLLACGLMRAGRHPPPPQAGKGHATPMPTSGRKLSCQPASQGWHWVCSVFTAPKHTEQRPCARCASAVCGSSNGRCVQSAAHRSFHASSLTRPLVSWSRPQAGIRMHAPTC